MTVKSTRMGRIELWKVRSLEGYPGVSLYQMRGDEEKHSEMAASMPMATARVG